MRGRAIGGGGQVGDDLEEFDGLVAASLLFGGAGALLAEPVEASLVGGAGAGEVGEEGAVGAYAGYYYCWAMLAKSPTREGLRYR